MRLAALALVLCCSASASADTPAQGAAPAPTDLSPAQFLAVHDQLAQDLRTRSYDYVDAAHLAEISKAQGSIHQLLEGKQSMADLDEQQRAALAAANAEVYSSLDDAKLDKKTCRQQHVMGSRRPKLVCQSERDRRELAERTKIERLRGAACTQGSSVSCTGG